MKLQIKRFKTRAAFFRKEKEKEVVSMYLSGKTTGEIATELKCTKWLANRILHEKNITLRTNKEYKQKYTIDESVFKKIDNEGSAYFLGLLYADGCNNLKKGTINMTLNIDDIDLLYSFKKFLKTDRPILFYQSKNPNSKKTAILPICNTEMCVDVDKLGCVPNKTFKIKFPYFIDISLRRHFIRGYFDGDGSISLDLRNNRKSGNISFVGTSDFCNSLSEIFNEKFGEKGATYTRHPERKNNIRQLMISKTKKSIEICDWLYKDANYFLERKKEKFLILKEKNKQCQ